MVRGFEKEKETNRTEKPKESWRHKQKPGHMEPLGLSKELGYYFRYHKKLLSSRIKGSDFCLIRNPSEHPVEEGPQEKPLEAYRHVSGGRWGEHGLQNGNRLGRGIQNIPEGAYRKSEVLLSNEK